MNDIYLQISDTALAEAILEQLKFAAIGDVQDTASLPREPPQEIFAILVDEAACNPALLKSLEALKDGNGIVFFLGTPPEAFDKNLITEIFSKPLRLGHLLHRLQFYLEIAPKLRAKPIAIGPYRFEAQQRNLKGETTNIRLTEKETALLEYIAQSPSPLSREELLASIWGYSSHIDTHTLETHIYQLRRKIGAEFIINENGLYRLAK